jgi:hypothetical protein
VTWRTRLQLCRLWLASQAVQRFNALPEPAKLRLAGWAVGLTRHALQTHLRGAERLLPAVAELLPRDRKERALWAFAQLKDALEGRQTSTKPAAAPKVGA